MKRVLDSSPPKTILEVDFSGGTPQISRTDGGSLSTRFNHGATITEGWLDCRGGFSRGAFWEIENRGSGSIRFLYAPGYTGTPSSGVDIVSISNISEPLSNISLNHSSLNGALRITVNDILGVPVYMAATIGRALHLVSGMEYEMALSWSSDLGDIKVFMDGVEYGSLTGWSWLYKGGPARLYLGADPNRFDRADARFNRLRLSR